MELQDMQKQLEGQWTLRLETMEIIQKNQINEMTIEKKYKKSFKKLWNWIHWCAYLLWNGSMELLLIFKSFNTDLILYGMCASNTFVFSYFTHFVLRYISNNQEHFISGNKL